MIDKRFLSYWCKIVASLLFKLISRGILWLSLCYNNGLLQDMLKVTKCKTGSKPVFVNFFKYLLMNTLYPHFYEHGKNVRVC